MHEQFLGEPRAKLQLRMFRLASHLLRSSPERDELPYDPLRRSKCGEISHPRLDAAAVSLPALRRSHTLNNRIEPQAL
jgi:hypothetical protein